MFLRREVIIFGKKVRRHHAPKGEQPVSPFHRGRIGVTSEWLAVVLGLSGEDIFIKEYATVPVLFVGLNDYFHVYNYERPHQSLGYCVPADVHFAVKVPIL